jgi:Gpi18-like mannosyltransferase
MASLAVLQYIQRMEHLVAKKALGYIKPFLLNRERTIFIALLIAAVVIRLPLMTYAGYYGDLLIYIRWGENVTQHFTSIYTTLPTVSAPGGSSSPGGFPGGMLTSHINYPPATPYLFGAIVLLYNHLLEPAFHASLEALVVSNGIGPFLAKIPLLLVDIAAFLYLYIQARKRHTATFALILSASFAFSPALLYNGVIWGQTDGFVSFPLLVALFALVAERSILAGTSLALAVLIKPQPAIFIPLILLYLWRWAGWRPMLRFAAAGLLTALLVLLPILLPHFQLLDMFNNIRAESYNDGTRLTSDAFNFWQLIGYGQQSMGSTLLGIKSGTIGIILFGAVSLLCGAQVWRHREPMYLSLGLAVQVFGFFFFMGGQHERYLFLFIPLAAASIILARGSSMSHLLALYVLGTFLCFFNMAVGVGGGFRFTDYQVIPFLTFPALHAYLLTNFNTLATFLAFLHLGVFLYALSVYLAQPLAPAQQPAPDTPRQSRCVLPAENASALSISAKTAPFGTQSPGTGGAGWRSFAILCLRPRSRSITQWRRIAHATRPASANLSGPDGRPRRAPHTHPDP